MKTILLPTDFSETAKNAAIYAVQVAGQIGVSKIVLYNAFQVQTAVDPTLPAMQLLNIDEIKKISEDGMKHFESDLVHHAIAGIQIETLTEFAILHNSIDEVCRDTGADLIVMGITGGGGLEEVLIGSNTINVINHTKVPVLIIPAKARYKQIKKIVFIKDNIKNLDETLPAEPIKKILDVLKSKLIVLDIKHSKSEESDIEQPPVLENVLQRYNAEYQTLNPKDFAEEINNFVEKFDVDLIITVPKKYGFFEGLFKRSHTKQLAYHTHVPLLCLHD